jgi:hypothetical protein
VVALQSGLKRYLGKLRLTPIMEDLRDLMLSTTKKKSKDDFELSVSKGLIRAGNDASQVNLMQRYGAEVLE